MWREDGLWSAKGEVELRFNVELRRCRPGLGRSSFDNAEPCVDDPAETLGDDCFLDSVARDREVKGDFPVPVVASDFAFIREPFGKLHIL